MDTSLISTKLLVWLNLLSIARSKLTEVPFHFNTSFALKVTENSTAPSNLLRPVPSNMVFLGYQHNYYNYDNPNDGMLPIPSRYAKKERSSLAQLKLESSFKTAQSAAQNRRNKLGFAGFGNHGHKYFYDLDNSASEEASSNGNIPATEGSLKKKFDDIYGISTGKSYTPACVRSQLQTICLDDPYYPTDSIKEAVLLHQLDFAKLYAEVAFQSADNLCDGLSRVEEEKYCNVFSQIHPISSANSWTANFGYNTNGGSSFDDLRTRTAPVMLTSLETLNGKGYICTSVIHYARILRAKNHRGQWRILVNIPGYTQTSRIEECTRPLQRCQFITPKLNSACIQKWNFQRLLVWDKYNGFEMDIFRLPTSCSCFIRPRLPHNVLNFFPVVNSLAPPVNNAENTELMQPAPSSNNNLKDVPNNANNAVNSAAVQTSESQPHKSYLYPPNAPPNPYLYSYFVANNLLPGQNTHYFQPGTVHVETADYGGNVRAKRHR